MSHNSYNNDLKNQFLCSALHGENATKIALKRGERKRGLPPVSAPVVVEEGEMGEGENRVREKRRERAGVLNEEGRRREEKKKGLLGF